jgi:hypothetical protein
MLSFVANILVDDGQNKLSRAVGYIVYALLIFYYPIVLFWYHGWDLSQVWRFAGTLEPATLIILVLAWVAYFTVPILAHTLAKQKDQEAESG